MEDDPWKTPWEAVDTSSGSLGSINFGGARFKTKNKPALDGDSGSDGAEAGARTTTSTLIPTGDEEGGGWLGMGGFGSLGISSSRREVGGEVVTKDGGGGGSGSNNNLGFGYADEMTWSTEQSGVTMYSGMGINLQNADDNGNTNDHADNIAWGGWDMSATSAWCAADKDAHTDSLAAVPWGRTPSPIDEMKVARTMAILDKEKQEVEYEEDKTGEKKKKKKVMALLNDEQTAWAASLQEDSAQHRSSAGHDGEALEIRHVHSTPSEEEETLDAVATSEATHATSALAAGTVTQTKESNVQKLVDMYDNIARKPVESCSKPDAKGAFSHEAKKREATSAMAGESAGVSVSGGTTTEELTRSMEDEAAQGEEKEVISSDTSITDKDSKGTTSTTTDHTQTNDVPPTEPPAMARGPQRSPSAPDAGVAFPVDFSLIDMLFPSCAGLSWSSTASGRRAAEPNDDFDDVISGRSDNFSTISERRTWYRVSRLGSMRKHDGGGGGGGGDDEHCYRRIGWWAESVVRADTLRTVRRWMEEDSIAGRVVLGGGRRKAAAGAPLGASMFNWDLSEPPVGIGELLRQWALGDGCDGGGRRQEECVEKGSVPDLGDGTTTTTTTTTLPPPPHSFVVDSNQVPANGEIPDELASQEAGKQIQDDGSDNYDDGDDDDDNDDDDDDDWGEMVSSSSTVDGSAQFASLSAVATQHMSELDFGGLEFMEAAHAASTAGMSTMESRSRSSLPICQTLDTKNKDVADAVDAVDAVPSSVWTPESVPMMMVGDSWTLERKVSVEKRRRRRSESCSVAAAVRRGLVMPTEPVAEKGFGGEDALTVTGDDDRRFIEEVLCGLADLSYMLR